MSGRKKQRQIQPVESRSEKRRTYQEQVKRYNTAIREGFYLEAIMIDYACMEDRLKYMLFYLGLITNESDYQITGNSLRVQSFREILHEYVSPKEKLSISSISAKRAIVQGVFCMANADENPANGNSFKSILWKALHDQEHITEILSILKEMEGWCDYRNEVVHALLNKNTDSLYAQLEHQAAAGFKLFRRLDNQVQWVRRKRLREKMKLNP